jgi:hypothetical protein
MLQGPVLDVPSSRGKSDAAIDQEIDRLVTSTPPDKIAELFGLEPDADISSISLAGRRALQVVTKKKDDVSGQEIKVVQTMMFRNGRSYQIICGATAPDFAAAWKTFGAVANSFRFF